MPSIKNTTPTALDRICSLTLLANIALTTPLIAALMPMINPAGDWILPCIAYPTAPEHAVIVIRSDAVPIAR